LHLEIPFDAAEILHRTSLKQDHPDVWRRYLNNRVIRFGKRVGAQVKTRVGRSDLLVIRDYFCLWLSEQELIPDHLREREDTRSMRYAHDAVGRLSMAIDADCLV
jgi:hypothetical protein